jgi:hypothetical protein
MLKTGLAASLLASGLLASAPVSAAEFVCNASEKQHCSPGRGCQKGVVTVYAKFAATGPGKARYSRCDRTGCETYEADTYNSGVFVLIELPGRASFAKVGPDGAWTEVVSLGQEVILAHGRCAIEAPSRR